jgi:hypothetical protein
MSLAMACREVKRNGRSETRRSFEQCARFLSKWNYAINYEPLGIDDETERPQAFSRCGHRVKNCSVLKSPLQPRCFRHCLSFHGVWSRKFCSSEGTSRVLLN